MWDLRFLDAKFATWAARTHPRPRRTKYDFVSSPSSDSPSVSWRHAPGVAHKFSARHGCSQLSVFSCCRQIRGRFDANWHRKMVNHCCKPNSSQTARISVSLVNFNDSSSSNMQVRLGSRSCLVGSIRTAACARNFLARNRVASRANRHFH
jgi:hypothetical protein